MPGSIKVGPYELIISLQDRLCDPSSDQRLFGRYEQSSQLIRLDTDQAVAHMRVTLTHELTHALAAAANVSLTEDDCEQLSVAWLALLRDNPELVAYLTAPTPRR